MRRARKFLIVLAALVILFAVFGRPPSAWKQVHAGMTWPEANAVINQKGVATDWREVVSADGQRHATRTVFFYGEFVVFPVWVLHVDLIDDRVQQVRSGLNVGSITRVSHD